MKQKSIHRLDAWKAPFSRGFSLVELMVAITIGLILLAGISSVMVSTKKSYNTQDSLSRLQENARIALMIMSRELKNAGYTGCNINMNKVTNVLKGATTSFDYNLNRLLEGSESGGTWRPSLATIGTALGTTIPRANTDLFLVRGAEADGSLQVLDKMPNSAASLKVSSGSGIVAGEILILSDCSSTDIFQVTGNTGSGGFDNIGHSTSAGAGVSPGNASLGGGDKLSKAYGDDATLMRFKSTVFYIGTGTSGEPALFRRRISTSGSFFSEELVEGIESLQVLYGEDTNGDRVAEGYVKADAVTNWDNVVSVRFGVISRALANLSTTDSKTANKGADTKALDVDGDGIDDFLGTETTTTTTENGTVVKDRLYDRRMFRTTVLLRNFQNREGS